MAITAVDKIKINKYLKEHNINDIYYLDMCEAIGKKSKISNGEFITYFTDCIIAEFNKDEKISVKHLCKLILTVEAFLTWMHDEKDEVDETVLDKIRSFKDFYDAYLNRCNIGVDEELEACINDVSKTIDRLYPKECNDECLVKYINEINCLKEEIKQLTNKFEELKKIYDCLEESSNEKTEHITQLRVDNITANNEIRKKTKEIEILKEQIELLKQKINELSCLLKQEQVKNEEFNKMKDEYDNLNYRLETLTKRLEEKAKSKINASALQVKHLQMQGLIYKKILEEQSDIAQILKYLNDQGFVCSKEEVIDLLKKIKKNINVDNSLFHKGVMYKVLAPKISEHTKFKINVSDNCKYYDIMLVSDFHISKFDEDVLNGFDVLYDYCSENNINLILNLGDFYHGGGCRALNYETAIYNYKIIEQTALTLPKVDGIYHAVLGGNHDKSILKYGYDPIELLSQKREDIINLGYTHSMIILQDLSNTLGIFDIHHYDAFFSVDMGQNGIDTTEINKYLNNLYEQQKRNRNTSYIDLIGHTHKSQLNPLSPYYYVPSYFADRINNGACHLRIYFDETHNIKYMVFMPLDVDKKLVKSNEIVYKRVYEKN